MPMAPNFVQSFEMQLGHGEESKIVAVVFKRLLPTRRRRSTNRPRPCHTAPFWSIVVLLGFAPTVPHPKYNLSSIQPLEMLNYRWILPNRSTDESGA
eukprot:m.37913 g.37913  ORF g.37913 m.37913 type:complete len:97 (+) comp7755_c0_seq2:4623-4913(+)